MFRDSVWWPGDAKRAGLLLGIVVLIVLRQNELFGLMDSTVLVFGWFPVQLAYDTLLSVLGIGLGYLFYRAVPDVDVDESAAATGSVDSATPGGEG